MTSVLLFPRDKAVEKALKGFPWEYRSVEETPSLVSYVSTLAEGAYTLIVKPGTWSPQHMTAAARILRSRGNLLILLGKRPYSMEKDISLLPRAEEVGELPELLRQPPKPPQPEREREKAEPEAPAPPIVPSDSKEKKEGTKMLEIPNNGEALILAVAGSRDGIGCTTQALVILRYLQSLGFAPCLLVSQELLSEWEEVGEFEERGIVQRMFGVPVAAKTEYDAYDCYIKLIGVLNAETKQEFLLGTDWSILVCGAGDVEWDFTAQAYLQIQAQPDIPLLISYNTSAAAAKEMGFTNPWAMAAWTPEPWQKIEPSSFAPYETLLKPFLEQKYHHRTYERDGGVEPV